jgi:hypothetical protein
MLWLQLHSNRGTQEMASFIPWGNQFYTIIRAQLQHYYNTSELASSTLEQHHAILHQALKVATINERLLNVNPAEMVVEKPVAEKNFDMQVWDEEEVSKFLTGSP